MTEIQLHYKLSSLERIMAKASYKDMPYLSATYNRLIDRAVKKIWKQNQNRRASRSRKKILKSIEFF